MAYPTDEQIKETYLSVCEEYGRGDNWNLRITADQLQCPISYIRNVLMELDSKGEL